MRQPSEFEMAVYDAIRKIPVGETRTYSWVARAIGRPRAARAVGNALHKNPFAPEAPCHRVIRSDGAVGGFAHGSARKQAMLDAEARTGKAAK
jgi:O-6-methylguanine DNA methyltransferase